MPYTKHGVFGSPAVQCYPPFIVFIVHNFSPFQIYQKKEQTKSRRPKRLIKLSYSSNSIANNTVDYIGFENSL